MLIEPEGFPPRVHRYDPRTIALGERKPKRLRLVMVTCLHSSKQSGNVGNFGIVKKNKT